MELAYWPSGYIEDDVNVKRLQTDRQTTDTRRSEKLTLGFSSCELKTTERKVPCRSCVTRVFNLTCLKPWSPSTGQKLNWNNVFCERLRENHAKQSIIYVFHLISYLVYIIMSVYIKVHLKAFCQTSTYMGRNLCYYN